MRFLLHLESAMLFILNFDSGIILHLESAMLFVLNYDSGIILNLELDCTPKLRH